ncbi:MAG: hypothetical protein ACREXW_05260 [Gammaproteobacteria bacterium]
MRHDPTRAAPTKTGAMRADSAKGGSATGRIGGALAALALAALLAAGPATAQLARQVAILQCAVVSDPPGSAPEIRVIAFSRSGTDVPSVQLGRECAPGLLDLLSRRFVIRSTLGDQAAGTVLYTLTRR